jgi:23S rRNA (adenine2503-C2)-methyltransferase
MSNNIYNLSFDELERWVIDSGEPGYRPKQLWEGLYRHLWNNTDQFSNLPSSLRVKLLESFSPGINTPDGRAGLSGIRPDQTLQSQDSETTKTLFTLSDGRQVEAVLMRYARRRTLCISTQAGCAMGCVFCATGQMGFMRNLSSGEIIEQVLYYARHLAAMDEQVTNIVVMGMGEPFHNYEATLNAIQRLNDNSGFNLGSRKFTISTVGLVPAIKRFTDEHSQINLAISLHAADDDLRTQLLPINKKYPLDMLLAACLD